VYSLPLEPPASIVVAASWGEGIVDATPSPLLLPAIEAEASAWAVYQGGTPFEPDFVTTTVLGYLQIEPANTVTPVTRVTYDGTDPLLVNPAGGALEAFDVLLPFP
jgi:hypothetical protein